MTRRARYYIGGNNSVLRFVLYELWDYKCYWCTRPMDYNDIQIDHIVPQTSKGKQLRRYIDKFELPDDFDLDDPMNLAPICSPCNGPGRKGANNRLDMPFVGSMLHKASGHRTEVFNRIKKFGGQGMIAKVLITVEQADLADPTTRGAFQQYAPAIVQKLALFDEDKVASFVSFKMVEVDLGNGESLEVGMSLDAQGRGSAMILERVCGGLVADVVVQPVLDLYQKIHDAVEQAFVAHGREGEPINSGPPVGWLRIEINGVSFRRLGTLFEFTFDGALEADLSASLVRYSDDGYKLVDGQGDAHVTGKYRFTVDRDLANHSSQFRASEPSIEVWEPNVSIGF